MVRQLTRPKQFGYNETLMIMLKVFGNMVYNPDTDYNRHNHFQTFLAGLLVLFR